MTHYIFKTPGKLETEAFTVMGLSAKDTDNPIGFFGTGLKYAIAIIMRLGGVVYIKSTDYHCMIRREAGNFRGNDYTKLICDFFGEDGSVASSMTLPYTTDYGKLWKPWMAFRELWSNTKDEGGEWFEHDDYNFDDCFPDYTYIGVKCSEFAEVMLNMNEYFIEDHRWKAMKQSGIMLNDDFEHGGCAFYPGVGNCFWRGVWVGNMPQLPYNVVINEKKTIRLGEDRTADYWALRASILGGIRSLVGNTSNRKFILDYAQSDGNNNIMSEADTENFNITKCKELYTSIADEVFDRHQKFPNVHFGNMIRKNRLMSMYEDTLDVEDEEELRTKVDEAVKEMENFNGRFKDFTIVLSDKLPDNVYALVRDGAVYLSANRVRECSEMQLKEILYEEFVHLSYGFADFTREIQNIFISDVINMFRRARHAEKVCDNYLDELNAYRSKDIV